MGVSFPAVAPHSNPGGEELPPSEPKQVTELLQKWRDGDKQALDSLMPLVYDELRRIARRYLQHEQADHTLQSTALVHEAYLRLIGGPTRFENRRHFYAVSAHLMRQILVDFARSRGAAKRKHNLTVTLDDAVAVPPAKNLDLLALDDALGELSRLSPRQSRIVELRFFGGLSILETADVMEVSEATVERDWTTARLWLFHQMSRNTTS
jgi:RNA polymerase sigma factor (TIGR02999 family)